MDIELSEFRYYFSVEGTEGGLYSLDVTMTPFGKVRDDADATKSVMQNMIDHFIAILDRLFDAGILNGEKRPIMQDFPSSLEVGYRYSGSYSKGPLFGGTRDISGHITDIFGIPDPDIRGNHSRSGTHSASLTFSARKNGEGLTDPSIVMKFSFDHKLNVAFFRFMQLLPDVERSDKASESITALDRTLALDWDRKGRDHYAEIKQVDQKQ